MRDDKDHKSIAGASGEDLIDPNLEDDYQEEWQEYEQNEERPRLTLVKPTDQNTKTDLPNDDPPDWPGF
jgi:hypothetical protein